MDAPDLSDLGSFRDGFGCRVVRCHRIYGPYPRSSDANLTFQFVPFLHYKSPLPYGLPQRGLFPFPQTSFTVTLAIRT